MSETKSKTPSMGATLTAHEIKDAMLGNKVVEKSTTEKESKKIIEGYLSDRKHLRNTEAKEAKEEESIPGTFVISEEDAKALTKLCSDAPRGGDIDALIAKCKGREKSDYTGWVLEPAEKVMKDLKELEESADETINGIGESTVAQLLFMRDPESLGLDEIMYLQAQQMAFHNLSQALGDAILAAASRR